MDWVGNYAIQAFPAGAGRNRQRAETQRIGEGSARHRVTSVAAALKHGLPEVCAAGRLRQTATCNVTRPKFLRDAEEADGRRS